MALDILTKDHIIVKDEVPNWMDAITIAAKPLLEHQMIEQSYVDAMINSVHELGPYIVIAPDIAIAHARPNHDVHQVGLSLLKLNKQVQFCDDQHKATLVFVLSAIDNTSHLSILQNLASLLGNQQIVQHLLEAKTSQQILSILKEND